MPDHDISSRLATIETLLTANYETINDKLDTFEHRLFGNGQPGELDKIRTDAAQNFRDVRETQTKTNERVSVLERFRWYLMGVAAGAGMLAHSFMDLVLGRHSG